MSEAAHLDVLSALDRLAVFPQLLDKKFTGLVDALFDGNGVGSRGDCL